MNFTYLIAEFVHIRNKDTWKFLFLKIDCTETGVQEVFLKDEVAATCKDGLDQV